MKNIPFTCQDCKGVFPEKKAANQIVCSQCSMLRTRIKARAHAQKKKAEPKKCLHCDKIITDACIKICDPCKIRLKAERYKNSFLNKKAPKKISVNNNFCKIGECTYSPYLNIGYNS